MYENCQKVSRMYYKIKMFALQIICCYNLCSRKAVHLLPWTFEHRKMMRKRRRTMTTRRGRLFVVILQNLIYALFIWRAWERKRLMTSPTSQLQVHHVNINELKPSEPNQFGVVDPLIINTHPCAKHPASIRSRTATSYSARRILEIRTAKR